jgi:hypothetical protein
LKLFPWRKETDIQEERQVMAEICPAQ